MTAVGAASTVDSAAGGPPALRGNLTVVDAHDQRERLLLALAECDGDLRLDVSAIQAVDSAGVQLLLAARRSLQARGAALRLVAAAEPVRAVLAAYGLGELLAATPAGA